MIFGFLLLCILGSVYSQSIAPKLLKNATNNALRRHNTYRSNHIDNKTTPIRTTRPLAMFSNLTKTAQNYAETLAKQSEVKLPRSGTKGLGENLYVRTSSNIISNATILSSGIAASKLWYDEINKYNYSTPGTVSNPGTGRFTQLVWTNSTLVGFGFALGYQKHEGKDKYVLYVVANYFPAGNVYYRSKEDARYFEKCVLPPQANLTTLPAN